MNLLSSLVPVKHYCRLFKAFQSRPLQWDCSMIVDSKSRGGEIKCSLLITEDWWCKKSIFNFNPFHTSLAPGFPGGGGVGNSRKRCANLLFSRIVAENCTKTRLHSSRMHTACLLTISPSMHCAGGLPVPRGCLLLGGLLGSLPKGGVCPGGECLPRGLSTGGVLCDRSHHTFDVTCMLRHHQLRPTNSAAAYILLVGHVTCKACWDTTPPPPP